VVNYFDRDEYASNPSRRKGAIFPCGYRVRALKGEAERREYGEHALCLDPGDGRRAWYLRCDSESERARWQAVLKYATLHAQPPLSEDPVAAAAFRDAYEMLRRRLGLWGWYRIDRSEPEQIASLIRQVCVERILPPLLRRLDAGTSTREKDGSKVKQALLAELDRVVGNISAAGWKGITEAVGAKSKGMSDAARDGATTISNDMEASKKDLSAKVSRVLSAAAADAMRSSLKPVLAAFLRPLRLAHEASIRLFRTKMLDLIDQGLPELRLRCVWLHCIACFSPDSRRRSFFKNCKWQRGELLPAFLKIRAVTRGELPEDDKEATEILQDMTVTWAELVELMQGVTLWEVERIFEDSLIEQVTWAIFTFVSKVEGSDDSAATTDQLNATTRLMIQDAVTRAHADLRKVIHTIFCPIVRRIALKNHAVQEALRGSAYFAVGLRDTVLSPAVEGAEASTSGEAEPSPVVAASSASASSDPLGPSKAGASTRRAERLAAENARTSCGLVEGFVDSVWLLDELVEAAVDVFYEDTQGKEVERSLNELSKLNGGLLATDEMASSK
jgi:hypothetical protein